MTPQPSRAARCRLLDPYRNPCPNLAISDFGLCLTHLHGAHDEYEQVLDAASLRNLRALAE